MAPDSSRLANVLSVGSFAIVEILRLGASSWHGLTGGGSGLNVPILPGGPEFASRVFLYSMLALALVTFVAAIWVDRSSLGFGLRCIRQNESAASMVGINVFRTKCAAFIISGFLVSTTGAVYASMVAFIEPKDVFNVLLSIEVPVMVMLGGAGTIVGPLAGAALYVLLKELVWVNFINFHTAILGVIIIAVIYVIPGGILRQFHAKAWSKLSTPFLRPNRAK